MTDSFKPPRIECVWQLGAELGEGPIWSEADHCVWFVDIKQQRIHRFDPRTGLGSTWKAPAPAGFVVPIAGGGFVAGLKTGLHRFDPSDGSFALLKTLEDPSLDNRLNDGYVDSRGRLWFGSMHDPEQHLSGALYRLDERGTIRRVDDGYCITNGPAVCPEGRTLYHVDSMQRVIYAFDIDARGDLHHKRPFTTIEAGGGYPDGICVDALGGLWVALFGGWGLRRYSPSAELTDTVSLPCANVTKAAFGGSDRRTLYITSARKGLTAEELGAQPLAGGLFALRVATPGMPQYEVAEIPSTEDPRRSIQ